MRFPESGKLHKKDSLDIPGQLVRENQAQDLEIGLHEWDKEIKNEEIKKLQEQNQIDDLTQLVNQKGFRDELERSLATIKSEIGEHNRSSGESLRQLSVLFIDLDNFKQVNDRYGHLEGNKTLIKIAEILKGSVRKGDVIARFGGDEFYILLPRVAESKAIEIADKIRINLSSDTLLARFGVTASIGALFVDKANVSDVDTVINQADIAAYYAKNAGKNRVEVYVDGMEMKDKKS